MENPWEHLSSGPPYLAEVDRSRLAWFRGRPDIDLGLVPNPHAGDPAAARLVFLLLSPSIETEHTDQADPHFRQDCLDLLVFRTNPPFLHVADRYADRNGHGTTAAARWWRRRLRDLADAVGGYEPLGRSLLNLEFFAYHCPGYKPLPGILPSQKYTFDLLTQAINRDLLVVVGNGFAYWNENVPALTEHHHAGRVVRLRSPRAPYLSPGNMEPDQFEAVVDAVRDR